MIYIVLWLLAMALIVAFFHGAKKASEEGLVQSAQLMAAWAFNTARYPTLLPRKKK